MEIDHKLRKLLHMNHVLRMISVSINDLSAASDLREGGEREV